MAATNIFYRIPSQRGTRVATIAGTECTLHQFCDYIIDNEGLQRSDFIVASGTKVFRPNSCSLQSINLQNNSHVDILIPLLGGKGGFGSLLRAIGAQIEKTTNRDACRDLSGRRLRDVKREEEIKKLYALQEKLQEEKKRRRRAKLEKLKKKSETSTTSSSIQELVTMFDDHAYNKRRLELGDILEAAMEKGIINFKKRKLENLHVEGSDTSIKSKKFQDASENLIQPKQVTPTKSESNSTTSTNEANTDRAIVRTKTKEVDIWLGLEESVI